MIRFTIDELDIQRAELHLLTHGGPRSHEENLIGALGELAVYNWINQWSPCYFSDQGCSYDLLLGDARTVEIKTQKIAVPPMEHYRVNLSMDCWENKLGVDVWIFVMVHEALKHGWIVASCLPNKRDRFSSHFAGDSMINGHKYRTDTMDCPISELDDPTRLMVNA
jgi:hypothetical protein